MKSLVWITAAAALVFGFNTNTANASNIENVEAVELSEGRVGSSYDANSEILTLRMFTSEKQERVVITVSNSFGDIIHQEKTAINARGTVLDISLAGNKSGIYNVTVKGTQTDFRDRFKKK